MRIATGKTRGKPPIIPSASGRDATNPTPSTGRRVAPVPLRSPDHAEGAPEPALSLPKGSLAFGDRGWKRHAAQPYRLEYSRSV